MANLSGFDANTVEPADDLEPIPAGKYVAVSVAHGRRVVDVLRQNHGVECGFVCGETPANERDELLARFRGETSDSLFDRKPLRYLWNVNVLTTGFDAPRVDCAVMLRATMSPGLLYQCVGRGFRLHPDKQNCLVLDFGGNIERHGPIRPDQTEGKAASREQRSTSQGVP